jgi:hypothetical protein
MVKIQLGSMHSSKVISYKIKNFKVLYSKYFNVRFCTSTEMDWDLLEQRKVRPPFRPRVVSSFEIVHKVEKLLTSF